MSGARKVFISYSHQQGDWVWDRLVPVLKAGGAEVLIDLERFTAGRALVGQMDATQDAADVHVLVFSPDYLASAACVHEMERAIACDPGFEKSIVVPVKRVDVTLPASIRDPNPLYVNLTSDTAAAPWNRLLGACGVDLGTDAPAWLEARDETRRFLLRGQSVNLVVNGDVEWRALLTDLQQREGLTDLAVVNLERPATASRRGLATEILRSFGMPAILPTEPEDLVEFDRLLSAQQPNRLALTHFDLAVHRSTYDINLFAALRYLVMDSRRLVLLVQSRRPFATLLPLGHPLSEINLQTVALAGRR
jgi:hypothetical protein